MTVTRRNFIAASGFALAGVSQVTGRAAAAAIPEAPTQASPLMQPPLYPSSGPDYQPVVTLNGGTGTGRNSTSWRSRWSEKSRRA